MPSIVEAHSLTKKYQARVAVAGIDFQIEAGEAFGFLGPNGAGKTSTLKIVGCVSPLGGGNLKVMGWDVSRQPRYIKAKLGVVPQRENLDPDLSVGQNLMVYARYFDIPPAIARARAWETLGIFQLQERWASPIPTLSDGMKRRLLIARALLNQPSLLILDEPTSGLDPQARLLVWQKLRYLQSQGTTLLLSTHNMEEAAQLCDRLVIMDRGHILAQGSPGELVRQYAGKQAMELHFSPGEKPKLRLDGLAWAEVGDTIYVFEPDAAALGSLPSQAREIVRRQATLEDVFLRLTGRGLEE